jgi:hypothetical protein
MRLALFLFACASAWGQVTPLDVSNSFGNVQSGTLTLSQTISTGHSNVVAVACVGALTTVGASGITATYGGQPMVLAAGGALDGGEGSFSGIYLLPNPPTGPQNLVVTNSSNHEIYGQITSFSGVNQISPYRSDWPTPITGAATNPSLTIPSTASDRTFACIYMPHNPCTDSQTLISCNGAGNLWIGDSYSTTPASSIVDTYTTGYTFVAMSAISLQVPALSTLSWNASCPSSSYTATPSASCEVDNSVAFDGSTNTVTLSDGGAGGTFTSGTSGNPLTVTPAAGTSFTYTYTGGSTGAKSISLTNNFGANDPAPMTITVSAPPPSTPTCTLVDGGVGAACHSGTCSLSAIAADTTHSNWSGSGCTANGYVPSSDYIAIPDGFTLTADQPWIVGNYGLPTFGYVYGVTGLPAGGFSGNCTATFAGGNQYGGYGPHGDCTISGGNVATFTLTSTGAYVDAALPTVSFTGSGGGSGSGTVQFVGGGGTPALDLKITGLLHISSTVTARGSIQYSNDPSYVLDSIIGDPGGTLKFDSSGAADPTDTRYSFSAKGYNGFRAFHAEGTPSQHFTVTSQAGGGNGFFNAISANYYCCSVIATYTDFSNLGDALFGSIVVGTSGALGSYDVQHSTFTNTSEIYVNPSPTSTVRHDYNVHSAPTGSADISINGTSAVTTGVREAVGNVFASSFQNNQGASGIAITGNYMGSGYHINGGYADPWASFTRNFYRFPSCDAQEPGTMGSISNLYYYVDGDCNNMHGFGAFPSTTYDGMALDVGGDTGYGDANWIMANGVQTSRSLTHSITVVSASGFASAPIVTFLYGGTNDGTWTVDHNSIGTSGSTDGAVDTETNEASAGQLASFRSNLIWGLASVPAGYNPGGDMGGSSLGVKFLDSMGAGAVTDVGSPANLDYNDGWNLVTSCNYAYQNQANQYCAKFSTGPDTGGTTVGAHDLSQNARFVDSNRNLMLFDYYYLGHRSYPAWSSSHGTYNVGDTVVNPISWFYGGLYVNYRCILAHSSSDTTTEPGSARFYFHLGGWVPSSTRGENWRTYWEPTSLYQLRQGVAAQTTIADGAIGCVACSIIDALHNWVFVGYTPTNPALWCAGHDGETIGATPFCGKGKALVAAAFGSAQ